MFLGIEIGGTKLQLGVGDGRAAQTFALERLAIEPALGAAGIRQQLAAAADRMLAGKTLEGIGIGFGGPVDSAAGRTIKSHQIVGWDDFPLAAWCAQTFGAPTVVQNDADTAALAEARFGAGRGANPVFYVTVGSGIGGGLIVDGKIYRGAGRGAAEIGHLRPGLHADHPDVTVESLASGWGIAAQAQTILSGAVAQRIDPSLQRARVTSRLERERRLSAAVAASEEFEADLLARAEGQIDNITGKLVADAAREGNALAADILQSAWQALGWGIAQVITLTAPEVVVVGGGVALLGEEMLQPLREEVARYVFPPFLERYRIVPAELGEEMVVYGALALAAEHALDKHL
jgi:glucokinase